MKRVINVALKGLGYAIIYEGNKLNLIMNNR